MKKDPIFRTLEDWTGHTAAKQEARRLGMIFLMMVCAIAVVLMLTSCMTASGTGWKTTAIATDASKYKVTAEGIEVLDLNQTKGFGMALAAVEKMWKNYLVAAGLKWVAGKYYDHQDQILAQDTTVKLEQLRNAKSVADAEAALKVLEANHAAEAAAIPIP